MQHPPDEEQRDESSDEVDNPVARSSWSSEVEHGMIVFAVLSVQLGRLSGIQN